MATWLETLPPAFRQEPLGDATDLVRIHTPFEWSDGDGITLLWDPLADSLSDGGETAFRLWAFGDAPDDASAAYAVPPVEATSWGLAVRHPTSVDAVAALISVMQSADRWLMERQGA